MINLKTLQAAIALVEAMGTFGHRGFGPIPGGDSEAVRKDTRKRPKDPTLADTISGMVMEARDEPFGEVDPFGEVHPFTVMKTPAEFKRGKQEELNALIESHGLEFVYSREFDMDTGDYAQKGGTVVAYSSDISTGNIVHVATAICHSDEKFSKLDGKLIAAMSFDAGAKIKVRLVKGHPGKQLRDMFDGAYPS